MLMLRFLPMTWVFALGMGATQAVLADDQTGTAFFEQKIRPVLVAECYQCHSAEAAKTKKLKAELYLDSRAGVLAGGESGPAVVPGKVEDSVLISALRHDSFEMPPKGKLPDEVIANFVRWVEMGAPDPRDGKLQATNTTVDVEAGRKHWAFQPLGDFAPPEVSSQQRVRAPIDQFVLARQEAAGIQAAPQADQRTLLRRAYFDLVGLPPSPEDVEAFLSDTSPDAYEKLIDRLLASEHYGERWATGTAS